MKKPCYRLIVLVGVCQDNKIDDIVFFLPNQKIPKETPLSDFIVSVDDVELMSWLDFFNVLDKETEEKIEGGKPGQVWQ